MKVFTVAVNNPIFIEIQHILLKRYMPTTVTYEFIVFNDAKNFPDDTNYGDIQMPLHIENKCKCRNC